MDNAPQNDQQSVPQQAPPPPPDLAAISHHLRGLSDQVTRVGNLPIVDNNVRVLEILERMDRNIIGLTQRMTGLEGRMNRGFRQVETSIQQVETSIQQVETSIQQVETSMNALSTEVVNRDLNQHIARENGDRTRSDDVVMPLHSLETGEILDDFPRRVADFHTITVRHITPILESLKLQTSGNIQEKRQRLMLACGLTVSRLEPVQ